MPRSPKDANAQPKLSRADARLVKKIMTGPLMGDVAGNSPPPPEFGTLAARPAPLGDIRSVRARIAAATDDTPPS